MKKLILGALCLSVVAGLEVNAGVTFLANSPESIGNTGSGQNSDRCANEGYIYTSCEGALVDECPYQSGHYSICCQAGYKYTLEECGSLPHSTDNCHGYYKCEGIVVGNPFIAEPIVEDQPSTQPEILYHSVMVCPEGMERYWNETYQAFGCR